MTYGVSQSVRQQKSMQEPKHYSKSVMYKELKKQKQCIVMKHFSPLRRWLSNKRL